jgi:hypothetical protein
VTREELVTELTKHVPDTRIEGAGLGNGGHNPLGIINGSGI